MKLVFPQTILALYAEVLDRNYADDQLIAIRRAYELQCQLFTGLLAGSGKSHLEHGVGTAGILVSIGAPLHLIQAAFVHNAYGLADFGDGLARTITPRRQAEVRHVIGERAEKCVRRFREISWKADNVARMLGQFEQLDELTRETLVLRLADHLEHHLDAGLLYRSSDFMLQTMVLLRPYLPELATRLGYPQFIEYFESAHKALDSRQVPACLSVPVPYTPPRSYSLRFKVRCIHRLTALSNRVRRPLGKIAARFSA